MKNKARLNWIIAGIFILILSGLASASSGCCFNPTNGLCSKDSSSASCSSPGVFFNSPTCNVNECNLGCCTLGTNTMFITERDCYLRSQNGQFEENFQAGLSIEQCQMLGQQLETGACLYGDYEPFDCNIKTRQECASGKFYANLTCTTAGLKTRCNKTSKTICNEGSVYFQDSCGNVDQLKQTCSYDGGTICETNSTSNAYCKSLNCANGKKNGERWCAPAEIMVGGRFFSQYCLNGEIITEPCADFRQEYCLDSSFTDIFGDERDIPATNGKCEVNPWSTCLEANADLTGKKGEETLTSEEKRKKLEENCDPDYCMIFGTGADLNAPLKAKLASVPLKNGATMQSATDDLVELLSTLGLDLCIPKIQPGIDFYSKTSSPAAGASTEESICSQGDYTGEVTFFKYRYCVNGPIGIGKYCAPSEWGLKAIKGDEKISDSDLGWGSNGGAALLDALPTQWTLLGARGEREGQNENIYCTNEDKKDTKLKIWCAGVDIGNAVNMLMGGGIGSPGGMLITALMKQIGADLPNKIAKTCDMYEDLGECPKISAGAGSIPASAGVVQYLEDRCKALGDCGGKVNYIDVEGTTPSGNDGTLIKTKGTSSEKTYKLEFTCKPWKAPEGGGDCGKCGTDKLPCSEYRCKSLGEKCKYYEPAGIDQGYCISSDDKTPPSITLKSMIPASPIKPFTPVEITISTNEISECKFNLNNAGARYSEMTYSFDEGYGLEHKVKLNLPGQIESLNENLSEYPLITQDGNYTMYVRCLDAAGNGETMVAYPIHFEVMKTPDNIITLPYGFDPISGSSIKFNTTMKNINFKTNEPVECRWSFNDKDYDLMENNFDCEELATVSSLIEGYSCSGTLTNVTLAIGEETTYYIRCKDQPWIENDSVLIKGVNYSRNTNSESYEYKLRGSEKLEITDISPGEYNQISGINASLELRAVTRGGVLNGQSTCYWRISNNDSRFDSPFVVFESTNSNIHSQTVNNPYLILGNRLVEVKCNDSAGNEEIRNQSFTLEIDANNPKITRLFYQNNNLRIQTDEESACYYSLNKTLGCDYNLLNATLMNGFEKIHTAPWVSDRTYYLKCKDFFGNQNENTCAGIIKTYYKI